MQSWPTGALNIALTGVQHIIQHFIRHFIKHLIRHLIRHLTEGMLAGMDFRSFSALLRCWSKDYDLRPTAEELVQSIEHQLSNLRQVLGGPSVTVWEYFINAAMVLCDLPPPNYCFSPDGRIFRSTLALIPSSSWHHPGPSPPRRPSGLGSLPSGWAGTLPCSAPWALPPLSAYMQPQVQRSIEEHWQQQLPANVHGSMIMEGAAAPGADSPLPLAGPLLQRIDPKQGVEECPFPLHIL